MREAEWLTCGVSDRMLRRIRRTASPRKARLFGVACGYRVWDYLSDPRSRAAVEVAERFADGRATADDLRMARDARPPGKAAHEWDGGYLFHYLTADDPREALKYWRIGLRTGQKAGLKWRPQLVALGHLVRCVFGNPYRTVAGDPAWRTSTAVALAAHMYESRDFSALPVLADALQDANCDSGELLDHCRSPGPHVRGCWVVDFVLDKE